jgi:hypothetical protein
MQKKGEVTEFNPVLICDLWAAIDRIVNSDEIERLRTERKLTNLQSKTRCYPQCEGTTERGFCHILAKLIIDDKDVVEDHGPSYNTFCRIALVVAFPWDKTDEGYDYWNKVYQALEVKE